MLIVKDLTFEVGNRPLFKNLNFTLEEQIYGLVGVNGSGKTTLARLLSGQLEPLSGHLIAKTSVHYFAQSEERRKQTVGEYLHGVQSDIGTFHPEYENLLLENIELEKEIHSLSGGQWTRVRLAQVLRRNPGFLILDEPTNHLDEEGRQVVENFLRIFQGGVLLISHDRRLLEAAEVILELTQLGLETFGGSFADFQKEKDRRQAALQGKIDRIKSEVTEASGKAHEKNERQAQRMRRGAKEAARGGVPKIVLGMMKRSAQQTAGKIKVENKEKKEELDQLLQETLELQPWQPAMKMIASFEVAKNHRTIVRAENLNLAYKPDQWILSESISFTIQGGDRVAITGLNGSGKSTLLRSITGELVLTEGHLSVNPSKMRLMYQDFEADAKKTVLDVFREQLNVDLGMARNHLALFGFVKDDVFKPVSILSGGEKLKLQLAQLFYPEPAPDLLILDEPTNHLDLRSLQLLERALCEYRGTIIIVSHDSVFLEKINISKRIQL